MGVGKRVGWADPADYKEGLVYIKPPPRLYQPPANIVGHPSDMASIELEHSLCMLWHCRSLTCAM